MADEFRTVATVDELGEGEILLVEHGRTYLLLYNLDGSYYAMEDKCSHADVNLSEGEFDLSACRVKCSAHGAEFDLKTGEVLAPPANVPVKMYEVRVQGDEIQVGARLRQNQE